MKRSLSFLLCLFFFSTYGRTQAITPAVVNTAGSTYNQGKYSFDWSVGESTLVTTMTSSNGSIIITNGFFQPNKWDQKINNNFFAPDEITILPNPTYGNLEIQFNTRQQGTIVITVYDNNARVLLTKKIISTGTPVNEKIDLGAQPKGSYLIHITLAPVPGSTSKYNTYKIIKI